MADSAQQSQESITDDQCPNPYYIERDPPQPYSPAPDPVDYGPPTAVSGDTLNAAHGHYTDPDGRAPVTGGSGWSNTDNDGTGAGPYAQSYVHGREHVVGAGLYDGKTADGVNVSAVSANARWGEWKDENGGNVSGADANAQVLRVSTANKNSPVNGEVGILDANDTMIDGDNETAIGVGANIVDGAATVGGKDNNARFGLSVGVGLGARYHHTLDPETNKRSYGIGFDAGPVSFDMRTDALSDTELNPTPEGKMENPDDMDDPGPRFNSF